jgi:GT2 family glycosyltransferase
LESRGILKCVRRAVSNTLETVRYWAGQKLLHSRFHPFYLKLSGKQPKPQTYEQWLAGERPGEAIALDGDRYELVLSAGVVAAPDAVYWLTREAERTGAAFVYADEDQVDAHGRRHSPVFRPGWSPELAAHCDYIGGAYLRRKDTSVGTWARVPRVLFHRDRPPVFSQNPDGASPQHLDSCLAALRARSAGAAMEFIAVVHMNQGQDEALLQVAGKHRAKTLRYREAFHFGRMCNLGVGESSGEYLLFLNDDVTPIDERWLRWMLAQAKRPKTGAVGALLYFPDGRIQHAGVLIGTPNGAGHPGRLSNGSPLWPWLTMTREVSAVTGACLLMPRSVFAEIGGFDEIFPVNYNDVDLCLRAGQKGYRVVIEARARLEHAESATRATGIRYAERQRFLERWAPLLRQGDPYFNPNLTDNELLLPDPEAHNRILAE